MPTYRRPTPSAVSTMTQQVAHAMTQLQQHGFRRYYTSMVGIYASELQQTLPYRIFADATQRAVLPLSCVEHAVAYTAFYAQSHFNRMRHVLDSSIGVRLRTDAVTKTVNVVDYGCGQALASLALLDYLQTYVNSENFTIHFHLVEPSSTTLALAQQLVTKMATRVEGRITVTTHQQDLATFLLHDDGVLAAADYTLHLFSNVLDIAAVQKMIPSLANHLRALSGRHMLLAVGPDYQNTNDGFVALKQALGETRTKQDVASFAVRSEIYSATYNRWQHELSKGVMMSLCFDNTANIQLPTAA